MSPAAWKPDVSLLPYWPTLEEIDACIRTEAETADEAILLAVHEPARLVRRAAYSKDEMETDESQLLAAFTSDDLAGGSLVLLISGTSGVGKSHMIRWLGAQLHRHSRSGEMHIITIPKSASLRSVVEKILEPLRGTQYDELRRELDTSVSSVSDGEAAIRLASELKIVLAREAERLHQELREGGTPDSSRGATSMRLFHARGLPGLLQDAALEEHFIKGVLPRIVSRALHGLPPDAAPEQEALGRFTPEDLMLLEEKGLAHAARTVEQYYRTVLNGLDGRNRESAVLVLNAALDPAIRRVFNLERVANGMTIEEIVDRVRVQLLQDDKELVLLVEDFAALAGIQESLLKLSIVEATHAGRKTRAVLRTALAVTDGYMEHRETILTRAKFEWIVKSRFDNEDQLLDHCFNLTGRYLNASRWGARNLARQFLESRERGAALSDWTPAFDSGDLSADDADTLEAFGSSDHGHRLFPLNRAAITGLCRNVLPRPGGRMEFNSRALINGVLRDPLQKRPLFESQRFPEGGFKNATVNSEVQIALDDSGLVSAEIGRAAAVLYYWGGDPASLTEALEMPRRIFQAFSIPPPFTESAARAKVKPKHRVGNAPTVLVSPVDAESQSVDSEAIEKFKQRLRAWADGDALTQIDARQIRSEWGQAVRDRIDAMELRVLDHVWDTKGSAISTWMYIPGAATGQPTLDIPQSPVVRFAHDDNRDPSGRVRKALAAMRRRTEQGGWTYAEAEDDFACYAWLLDQLTEQATHRIMCEIERHLSFLVPRLRLQSVLLGLTGRADQTPVELLAMPVSEEWVAEAPSGEVPQPLQLYSGIVTAAASSRVPLQEHVYRFAACYQGTGKIAYVLDAMRIARYATLGTTSDPAVSAIYLELREHLGQLTPERVQVGTERALKWLRETKIRLDQSLGVDSLKDLVAALERIDNLAKAHGLVERAALITETLDRLKGEPPASLARIRGTFLQIEQLPDGAPLEETMQVLARVPFQTLIRIVSLLEEASTFIGQVERNLGPQIKTLEDVDPRPVATSILALLAQMQETVDGFIPNAA
jgi:hypothetical protein